MKSVLLAVILIFEFAAFAAEVDPEYKNCRVRKASMAEGINALQLNMKIEYKLQELIEAERKKGNDPKIFVIGRVGQDVGGVVTLKNYDAVCEQMLGMKCSKFSKPKWLTVHDIFNDKRVYDGGLSDILRDAMKVTTVKGDIEKYFGDKARSVLYSHVGFLYIKHPVLTNPKEIGGTIVSKRVREMFEKGEAQDLYLVEEMLKPCDPKVMKPEPFLTGLPAFFSDEPKEYKTIIMIPDQKVQDRVYELMINEGRRKSFVGPRYNAATGFLNQNEQNSNQYILELLAAGTKQNVTNRIDAMKVLKETNYRPTMLLGTGFKISFANTPLAPREFNLKKSENPYLDILMAEIVTELSVREWGLRTGIIQSVHEVELPANRVVKDKDVIGVEYGN